MDDHDAVERQLGRRPRAFLRVAVRCPFGWPAVTGRMEAPALLLYVTFRSRTEDYIVLIPVVVMAAGQLAGGLAWLSISGEDAPDLIATAPVKPVRVLWAKIEAVLTVIAIVLTGIGFAFSQSGGGLQKLMIVALGISVAFGAATALPVAATYSIP